MSQSTPKRLAIAILASAVAAVVGLSIFGITGQNNQLVAASNIPQNQDGQITEMSGEEYKALYSERSKIAYQLVTEHPQAKAALAGIAQPSFELTLTDNQDLVKLKGWRSAVILGTWTTGYTTTFTGGKAIDAAIDRKDNSVNSLTVSDMPVVRENKIFTENQKRLIAIALADPIVQERLAGKVETKDYYIHQARDFGVGDNAWIQFSTVDGKQNMIVTVNQATGEVVRTLPWWPDLAQGAQ